MSRYFHWIAGFFQVILIYAAWGSGLAFQRPASLVALGSRILKSGSESRAFAGITALAGSVALKSEDEWPKASWLFLSH